MKAPVQRFALAFGAVYLAVGVLGFAVTGFAGFVENGDKAVLGFDLNPYHNIVHLVIGGMFFAAGRSPDVRVAAGVSLGTGAVFLIAAFGGFTNSMQLLSIDSATAPMNFLHLGTGVVAAGFGLLGLSARGAVGDRAGTGAAAG